MMEEIWQKYFLGPFCLVTIISQLVKTPLPQQKVSRQFTDLNRLIKLL